MAFHCADLFKPTETNMSPHSLSVSLAVSRLLKDSDQDVRNFLAKLADVAGSATQGMYVIGV